MEVTMTTERKNHEVKLTPEPRAESREFTGQETEGLELSAEELEQRITPASKFPPR